MQRVRQSLLALATLCGPGCYTADLDDVGDGALVCRIDDPSARCPDGLSCDGRVCLEEVPVVEITFPEGSNPGGQVLSQPQDLVIAVRARGLNVNGDQDDPNAGFVRVTLDGAFADVTEGAITDSVQIDFETTDLERPTEPGPHRLSARAFRADGTPFGNPEAFVTRLYWIDDGQPHVAITKPWHGETFELGTPLIDIEVAALNFRFDVSDIPVPDISAPLGHAHVYYDEEMPSCVLDPDCDPGYIAVVARTPGEGIANPGETVSTAAALPASSETVATLSAVLRRNNHDLFDAGITDPDEEPAEPATVVFDEIEILRADP